MPSGNYWWNDYYDDGPRHLPGSRYEQRRCCSGWRLLRISLLLCFIALVLQILGFACPGWMILSIDLTGLTSAPGAGLFGFGKVTTYAAVWYTRVCTSLDSQETCKMSTYHEASFMGLQLLTALSELASVDWVEIQVETTIALALCLLGIILCCVSFCDPCWVVSPKKWAVIVAGCMLASGVVLLPAVINMSEAYDKAKSAVDALSQSTGQDFVKIEIPWAMALTASGMALAIICCLLLLIAACLHHRRRNSRLIRSDSSVSDYSYRKRHYMVPTRYSGHHPGPIDGHYYKNGSGVASWGRRGYDGPAFDADRKDVLVHERHHGERPLHKSLPPDHGDFRASHSLDDREYVHRPRERQLALTSGHENVRNYPPSFDGRDVYRKDDRQVDFLRRHNRRHSYPRYIGPWEAVDYPVDRLLTLPPLQREFPTYVSATDGRDIVQHQGARQLALPPNNKGYLTYAPYTDDRQLITGSRDYLTYSPYADDRKMPLHPESKAYHAYSYAGDRQWNLYQGDRVRVTSPPYTDDNIRYSGERLGALAPVHRYFITNPHPIGVMDDVHRSGFRQVHRSRRGVSSYPASLDGKEHVHRVLDSNVINHL